MTEFSRNRIVSLSGALSYPSVAMEMVDEGYDTNHDMRNKSRCPGKSFDNLIPNMGRAYVVPS